MADKFILRCQRRSNIGKSVTIDVETWERLNNLKDDTGLAMGQIMKQAVDFALDRLKLVEE